MWDLPGPGLEPVSPTLADGFLTTVPPGKSGSPVFLFGTSGNSTPLRSSRSFLVPPTSPLFMGSFPLAFKNNQMSFILKINVKNSNSPSNNLPTSLFPFKAKQHKRGVYKHFPDSHTGQAIIDHSHVASILTHPPIACSKDTSTYR